MGSFYLQSQFSIYCRPAYQYIRFIYQKNSDSSIMSSKSSNKKLLALRQLHLSPHFIYLVNCMEVPNTTKYCLQLLKDDVKIGQTRQLSLSLPTGSQKFSSISFEKIRFVFDVEALFEQNSQSTIKLKLTQNDGNQELVKQEFRLHLLYYNYEYSSSNFIKQNENTIGKINHYIFNYSFSAIYGDPLPTLLFRKKQHEKHEHNPQGDHNKKKLKYGQIVKEQDRNSFFDTIFMLESVTLKGLSLPTNNQSNETTRHQSKISRRSTFFEDNVEDIGVTSATVSSNTDEDLNPGENQVVNEVSPLRKDGFYWFLLIAGTVLIYFLMHPMRRL